MTTAAVLFFTASLADSSPAQAASSVSTIETGPVSTGVEWAAAGVLLLLLAAVVTIVLRRIFGHPDGWREGLLTFGLRGYCSMVFGQHVSHTSTVPGEGAALVVANHRSPVDPLLMHSAASFQFEGRDQRVIEWITAREYAEVGGPVGWICRVARSIPVDRGGNDMAAVKEALKRLKQGRIVGIFPEGRINRDGGLLEFNPGLAFIAARAGVPVIPAYIDEAPSGETMIEPFLTPTKSYVRFGEPLDFTHMKRPTAVERLEIAATIREAVLAMMPQEKRTPNRPELAVVQEPAA